MPGKPENHRPADRVLASAPVQTTSGGRSSTRHDPTPPDRPRASDFLLSPCVGLLLAQGTVQRKADALREAFQNNDAVDQITHSLLWLVLGMLIAIAAVVIIARFMRRRQEQPEETRADLLRDLLAAMQFSSVERQDIRIMAHAAMAAEPASVLLTPANFAAAYRKAHESRNDRVYLERLSAIGQKVFGQPLPHDLPAAHAEES